MRKESSAFLFKNKIFIHAKKGTQSVPAFSEPLFQLELNDSVELIGNKVRKCIEAYQSGNERYDREKWKTVNIPLLKLAGVKGSSSFFGKALNVPINLENNSIVFFPTLNTGKGGLKWTQHPNIELDFSTATDEDLGKALLKAFELSSII